MRSKSSWDDGTNVAEIANMGFVFDGVHGTDRAERDRAEMGDTTDVAEMALRMNALFYFECLGHKEGVQKV